MLRSFFRNSFWFAIVLVLLTGCGGGGDGDTGNAVKINLNCEPTDVDYDGSVTLTWSAENVDACTASEGWSGDKAVSGSETIDNLQSDTSFTLSCTGVEGQGADTVTVTVNGVPQGSASLSWVPPTKNTDDSDLTDLAGYTIYYGNSPNTYTKTITVNDRHANSYVVEHLAPGTWYFAVAAFNTAGRESDNSNEGSKTIEP